MYSSLNSLKGVIYGTTTGVIKRDTKSLDYSSYTVQDVRAQSRCVSIGLDLRVGCRGFGFRIWGSWFLDV